MKEENLPACKWALARFSKVKTDKNNKIRICKFKTDTRVFVLPNSKVRLLPRNDNLN